MAAVVKHHSHGGAGYAVPALLDYVTKTVGREDAVLRAIRENTEKEGLPPINVGPDEGRHLDFFVRACGAKKAVEVGTLAGYSGAWIARALPVDGRLHTFEFSPKHAEVARRNFERAGVASKVTIHVGAAAEQLPKIESEGPFDFCFIDADKVSYPIYLRWAIAHTRPGAIVLADNAYLFGKLHLDAAAAGEDAPGAKAMREVLALMTDEKYFSSCSMIPTSEGMAVAVRR